MYAEYAEDGGALWERSVSAGFGYYPGNRSDVLGVGFNWSRPAEDVFGGGWTTSIWLKSTTGSR